MRTICFNPYRKWQSRLLPILLLLPLSHSIYGKTPDYGKNPERIITLTPHLTEMVYAVGAEKQLVATDDASDWPPEVTTLPHVANYRSINVEALLALQPDLIIAWGESQHRLLTVLKQLKIPVLVLDSVHLQDLPRELRLLGTRTGHPEEGNKAADSVEKQLTALKNHYSTKTKVRVFYQLWSSPLMTVAKGSWIQEAITLCGGVNPFADSPAPYPQIGEEAVVASNPDIILATEKADLARWQKWPMLSAVKQQQLHTLNRNWLNRLTPRILLGIDELCQKIDRTRLPGSVSPLANDSEK